MTVTILIILFLLWIIALIYAIEASSESHIQKEVNELRIRKYEKILEQQRKLEEGGLTLNELESKVNQLMSVCNKKTLE